MKKLFLLLILVSPIYGNVCTLLNVPANGPFPAIVNGIDAVGSNSLRFQWTSDISPNAPINSRIRYSTDAQWVANPGVYVYEIQLGSHGVTQSNQPQGWVLTNLIPNTLYHLIGETDQGVSGTPNWCTATPITVTTSVGTPAGTIVKPVLPQVTFQPRPVTTGTNWIYGSNCGTSGTITNKLQDCYTKAQPGDSVTLQAGVIYPALQVTLPSHPSAINLTCSLTGSLCTQTGSAPANGSLIVFSDGAPSPINPAVQYKVINSSGSSFGVSYDGTTPITFLNTGSSPMYMLWDSYENPSYIVTKSDASSSLLPPNGVRLGEDSLNQYLPYMPNLQATDPILNNGGIFAYSKFSIGYYWENVAFSTDSSQASLTPLDPINFNAPIQTGISQNKIVWDQCAIIPALPPSRSTLMLLGGRNLQMTNSFQSGLDFWEPHYYAASLDTVTPTSITFPPFIQSWVVSGGTSGVGQKNQCNNAGGTLTITGGTTSGYIYFYINASCNITAEVPTGLTATTTVPNMAIVSTTTPSFPLVTYTSPSGYTKQVNAAIPLLNIPLTNGLITATNSDMEYPWQYQPGKSSQVYQSGGGVYLSAINKIYFSNNTHIGSELTGVFWADDLTNGTSVCGNVNPCPNQYQAGDMLISKSTMKANNCYLYSASCWNGGNYYYRNMTENKVGARTWSNGNKFGPFSAQVGEGESGLHEVFGSFVGFPNYNDSSNWTFSNNTVYNTASTGITTNGPFALNPIVIPAYPMNNLLIRNNLFINNNGYTNVSPNQPLNSDGHVQYSNSTSCPTGGVTNFSAPGQNQVLSHNTFWGQGGCLALIFAAYGSLNQTTFTDNIFNLVDDPHNPGATVAGTYWNGNGLVNTTCSNPAIGQTLFNCMNGLVFKSNIMLATYKNSWPASLTEYTTSDINSVQSTYYSSYPAFWPNANSLSARANSIGWINYAGNNFNLSASSPYNAGSHVSSDGTDIGVNMTELDAAQGNVSNIRFLNVTSNSATLAFFSADSFACGVDWGTSPFYNGGSLWTRINGTLGTDDARIQSVTLSGLPSHSLVYYRLNCDAQQPTGSIQLP